MNYQEMLAQIRANPQDSGYKLGGYVDENGATQDTAPFTKVGSYFGDNNQMTFTPLGNGTYAAYKATEPGHASRLNGTQFQIVDQSGNVLGQDTWRGITDNNSVQQMIGMLSVAIGGPLVGGALAGAAAAGGAGAAAAGGAEAGALGSTGLGAGSSSLGLTGSLGGVPAGAGYGSMLGAMPAVEAAAASIPGMATYGGGALAQMGAWSAGAGALGGAAGSMVGEPPPANPYAPEGTPPPANPNVSNGSSNPFMKPDGTVDWTKALGAGSSLLGAASGAQTPVGGAGGGGTLDPRMEGYIYGDGGLFPQAQSLLNSQMPQAQQQSAQMASVGSGLLGAPIAGNGYGKVELGKVDEASNPYLKSVADDMQRRTSDLLGANNLQIQGNSVASGGLGGSRQGVAQGMAASKAADSLQGQVAGLYSGAYENDSNRALSKYGTDTNFYSGQRAQDLAGAQLGGGLLSQSQSQAWAPLNSASGVYKPYSGLASSSGDSGTNWQGLLGGAMSGAAFGKSMGWF